jgi:hypothetical protein
MSPRGCRLWPDWWRELRYEEGTITTIIRLLRSLRLASPPVVPAEEAARKAQAAVDERGWSWREPVKVTETLRSYRFWTNLHYRGGNVFVHVDARTGEVTKLTMAPR